MGGEMAVVVVVMVADADASHTRDESSGASSPTTGRPWYPKDRAIDWTSQNKLGQN